MHKWNKSIKAQMWADMITQHIEQQRDIHFIQTLTKNVAIISGAFLMCIWSLYFIFNF